MERKFAVLFMLLVACSGCVRQPGGYAQVKETREMMGTFVTITVMAEDEAAARDALNKSFEEVQRVSDLMSRFSQNNSVYQLNNFGYNKTVVVEPELASMMEKSLYYSNVSGGAFDITVVPILNLWNTAKNTSRVPTPEEINETLRHVGYAKLVVDSNASTAYFTEPNMSITLDGIAKGYAVDKAIETLQSLGIQHALVDAGGDMRALGSKPDGSSWAIALQNPRDEGDYLTIINLTGKSVATSGDYEQYFMLENKRMHHIVDPRTGQSAEECISVTVLSEKAVDADALATALFVMGPERGIALAEYLPDTEALVITSNKTILKTSGFE